MRVHIVVALIGILSSPSLAGLAAQQTPADSVAALVRQLLQRIDSLEATVARLQAQNQDSRSTENELNALRAAAQNAARATSTPNQGEAAQSRTRSLGLLNPEISVTGDIVGNWLKPNSEAHDLTVVPREFEFSFQAALDPYTHTKIFITREEDFGIAGAAEEEGEEDEEGHGFEIEEGYMYWVGLPGGFGAKVGKFRQQVGLYNRWHTHALMEVERPLAATTFLGEDGLIQTGAAVTFPSFTFGRATQTVLFEITRSDNDLFDGGTNLTYLGRFQSFWDFGAESFLQLGATGIYGTNDDVGLTSRLLVLDFAFRFTPSGNALYRDLQLKGEWYFGDRDEMGTSLTGNGGYLQANYRASRRWILGTRADLVEGFGSSTSVLQLAPSLTWWQSEWVRVRLQYNMLRPEGGNGNHTALLQFVWAMGPHKHETY